MITKPLDRVNEAYSGALGEAFSEKTRARVNWIVNHTRGQSILDIGCSQGIVPIILGREGKRVDALDIAEESIEIAKSALNDEHESVQKNIHFKVSNFMTEDDIRWDYETVLLTEVLEHISHPEKFIEKIYHHLASSGQLIVTVPFGINDYFDHKRTYYLLDLYDQLSVYFHIEKIDYLGKWTGILCEKKEEPDFQKQASFTRFDLEKLERGFYEVERDLVDRVKELQKNIRDKNALVKSLQSMQEQLKLKMEEKEEASNKIYLEKAELEFNSKLQIEMLNRQKEKLTDLLASSKTKNSQSESKIESLKLKIEELENLVTSLGAEHDRHIQSLKSEHTNLLSLAEEKYREYESVIQSLEGEKESLQDLLQRKTEEYEHDLESLNEIHLEVLENAADLDRKRQSAEKNVILLENKLEQALSELSGMKVLLQNKEHMLLTLEEEIGALKDVLQSSLESETSMIELAIRKEKEANDHEANYRHVLEKEAAARKELASSKTRYAELDSKYKKELSLMKEKYEALEQNYKREVQINKEQKKTHQLQTKEETRLKKELALKQKQAEGVEKKYLKEVEKYKKRYDSIERKYNSLKSSKLGQITLKYWKLRQKLGLKARGN